jgi:hypothetical protein
MVLVLAEAMPGGGPRAFETGDSTRRRRSSTRATAMLNTVASGFTAACSIVNPYREPSGGDGEAVSERPSVDRDRGAFAFLGHVREQPPFERAHRSRVEGGPPSARC